MGGILNLSEHWVVRQDIPWYMAYITQASTQTHQEVGNIPPSGRNWGRPLNPLRLDHHYDLVTPPSICTLQICQQVIFTWFQNFERYVILNKSEIISSSWDIASDFCDFKSKAAGGLVNYSEGCSSFKFWKILIHRWAPNHPRHPTPPAKLGTV